MYNSVSSIVFLSLIFIVVPSATANNPEKLISFDPDFLKLSDGTLSKEIDLTHFSRKGGVQPGEYELDIFVNGKFIRRTVVTLSESEKNDGSVQPVFTEADFLSFGINGPLVTGDGSHNTWSGNVDLSRMRYDLSVPQSQLVYDDIYLTPPPAWNNGIPAILVQYDYSGSRQQNNGVQYESNFVRLNSGVTVGGWILRNDSSMVFSDGQNQLTALRTYLQKGYDFWQGGQFLLGQTSTDGDFFDSIPFTGIQLHSDDGMLKGYFSQYAPVIRGVATSQSRVTIRQAGIILYQENVPPGPFELRDISTLSGGDLDVEIRGEDGTIKRFTQTAGSLPVLQREGRARYSLSTGQYRSDSNSDIEKEPRFFQGTLSVGTPYDTTLYGGFFYSEMYRAVMLGAGRYIPYLGGISADMTQARAERKEGSANGQSLRVSFAREFEYTGTSLNIASYRYSTKEFYSFTDALLLNDDRLRSRLQASVIQPLSNIGQLSFSGSRDNYWNDRSAMNFTAAYTLPFDYVSLNLSAGIRKVSDTPETDRIVMVGVNIPLSKFYSGRGVSLNTSTRFINQKSETNAGVSGQIEQFGYSVMQDIDSRRKNTTVSLSYNANFASMNGGYSAGSDNSSFYYGIRGGVALHPYGATLSRDISFSSGNALVMTPGASSVKIKNSNASTDFFGNAVVGNLISYQRNQLSLDMDTLPDNVEMSATDQIVIPVRGALIPVVFDANVGFRAVFLITNQFGDMPFGARVVLRKDNGSLVEGIIDENSQVYLSGLPGKGVLHIESGYKGEQFNCRADYDLTGNYSGVATKELTCI